MAAGDAGARRRRRLSRSGDFDRVYREGSSHATRYLVLYTFPRGDGEGADDDELRLGVSVSRKVGGAVERNRVKRTLREAFWGLAEELPPEHDFVLVARPEIGAVVEAGGTDAVTECIEEALSGVRAAGERST